MSRKRQTKKQQEEAYAAENADRDAGPVRGLVQRYSDKVIDELWRRAEHVHAGDPFTVSTTLSLKYPALRHSIPAHAGDFYCGGLELAFHLLATIDYWKARAEKAEKKAEKKAAKGRAALSRAVAGEGKKV